MIELLFGKQDNLLREAQACLSQGEFDQSRALLLSLIKIQPDNPKALLYLALVESDDSHFEKALKHINEALDTPNIEEPQVYCYFKALIQFDQRSYQEAINTLEQSDEETNYYVHLKSLSQLADDFGNNKKEEGEAVLKTLKSFSKSSLDIQARAIELLEKKIDSGFAMRASQASLPSIFQPIIFKQQRKQKAQKNVLNKLQKVDDLLSNHSLAKAIDTLEQAQEYGVFFADIESKENEIGNYINSNTDTAFNALGLEAALPFLLQAGHYTTVIKFSQKALSEEPNKNHPLHELLGLAYFSIKQYDEAINHLKQFITCQAHDQTLALYYIAASFTHSDQRSESIRAYKMFIMNALESYDMAITLNMKTLLSNHHNQ